MSRPGLYAMVFLVLMYSCTAANKHPATKEDVDRACKSQVE